MIARRSLLLLGVFFLSSACGFRSELRLDGGLVVDSVSIGQPDAVQGESGLPVVVRLSNVSAMREALGETLLVVTNGSEDRSADYTLTPVSTNATRLEPGESIDLAFTLAVDTEALPGSVLIAPVVQSADGVVRSSPAADPASLLVLRHARLEVLSQSVDGATCRDSRQASFRARLRNTGESTANLAAAVRVLRGAADVTGEFTIQASAANATTLGPGAEADVDFVLGSDANTNLGEAAVEVSFGSAADARSGADAAPLVMAAQAAMAVHAPAQLAIPSVTETRTSVSKGQGGLLLTTTVVNAGSVPALLQTAVPVFAIGPVSTGADYASVPPAGLGTTLMVPSAGTISFDFTVSVDATAASGATVIGALVTGTDATCAESIASTPPAATGAWIVQSPPNLLATTTSTTVSAFAGEAATVTLTVQNTGEATANAVSPAIAVSVCPTCVSLTAVDTGAKTIAAGASATYTWNAALSDPTTGAVIIPSLDARGAGTDANTGGAVVSNTGSREITVEARRPEACFTFTPSAAPVNAIVSFDASCSSDVETADAGLTFEWDFMADGVFEASGITATTSYGNAGEFRPTLRVTDPHGHSRTISRPIRIEAPLEFGCVNVTADEKDAGATPALPGGTGFSLREAIEWAKARAGRQTICFDAVLAGTTLTFPNGELPALGGGQNVIVGRRDVTIDFGPLLRGFVLTNNDKIYDLHLTGLGPNGIAKVIVLGVGNVVQGCEIEGGGGVGIAFEPGAAPDVTVLLVADNLIHGNPGGGIRIAPATSAGAADVIVFGNRVYANGADGIVVGPAGGGNVIGRNHVYGNAGHGIVTAMDGGDIVNNTSRLNGGDGVRLKDCGCAADQFLTNNLLVANAGFGLFSEMKANAKSDGANWIFGNVTGETFFHPTGGGGLGPADVVGTDPLLKSDGELARGSGCRNSGVDAPHVPDANGADAGKFYGPRMDVGAWESPR